MTTQQPEALDLANWLDAVGNGGISSTAAAAELRRQHAEIESLQARIKTMAEEHADELMVAHLDGRMRAAQPAGAQQSGVAYAALPDADRDYMRKVVAVAVTMLFDGYKEDVTRVFSPGELSEFVTITAAMGGERVEDIYRRAWDLLSLPDRASHGQAPAQAAPAAVAGPSEAVAYLDIGAGGYLDLGTDLSNEALSRLPKGRHALVIAGTYGIDGYTPTPPTQAAESVTAPASGANWQDISTAPKDGTRFVAVGQNYGLDSEKQHTCIAQWLAGCWVEVSDWNGASKLKYLTHWMPLPPLPGNAARAPADIVTAPAGGEVAYLDIGAGGYLDLGTDLSNEALSRLPKGRHALVIAGTYGIDGYTAAPNTQPAPDEILNMAREQGLPETETEGVFRVNVDDLGRMFAADRAARAPADSVTAPAGGEIDRLRAALVYVAFALHGKPQYMLAEGIALIDGDTVRVSRDGWTVEASVNPARATPPAQAADSVLEDAARYQWLRQHWFTMSSNYQGGITFKLGEPRWSDITEAELDAAIDAARKQGANHD